MLKSVFTEQQMRGIIRDVVREPAGEDAEPITGMIRSAQRSLPRYRTISLPWYRTMWWWHSSAYRRCAAVAGLSSRLCKACGPRQLSNGGSCG
jgi:hypothetical protein